MGNTVNASGIKRSKDRAQRKSAEREPEPLPPRRDLPFGLIAIATLVLAALAGGVLGFTCPLDARPVTPGVRD